MRSILSILANALRASLSVLADVWSAWWTTVMTPIRAMIPAKVVAPEEARQDAIEKRVDALLADEVAAVKSMSPAQSAAAHAALDAELTLGERTKQRLLDAQKFAGTDASDIKMRSEGERILRHLNAGDLRGLEPQIRAALKRLGRHRCADLLEAADPYAAAYAVAGWIAVNEVKRLADPARARMDARPYGVEAGAAALRM